MLDALRRFLTLDMPATEVGPVTRAGLSQWEDFPDLETQLAALHGAPRPWRMPSIMEALSVPAVFRAVSLIANTTGALSVEAFRHGVKLEPEDRPALVIRPDPFTTPRTFYRDTAYNIVTRGESWWWVAKRDPDGNPMSLLNIPPREVVVEEDPADRRYPIIRWRDKIMANRDMRQVTYLREPGALRGMGPLQVCGAAVSVAVEAQEWAANFFSSGGHPSILIKSAVELDEADATNLKSQWIDDYNNIPKVIDPGIEDVKELGQNAQGSQMLASRDYANGEVARMFGIPGSLLDYSTAGSSLTYQNLEGELTKWVRTGLWPNVLEGVEQELSDLLTRSTVARFNVDALQRADIKTRFDSYKVGIESGVLTPEIAQEREGILPGDVEQAPMPLAPPAAVPSAAALTRAMAAAVPTAPAQIAEVRCDGMHSKKRSGVAYLGRCNRLLSTTGSFVGTCPRCKKAYPAEAA